MTWKLRSSPTSRGRCITILADNASYITACRLIQAYTFDGAYYPEATNRRPTLFITLIGEDAT